MFPLRVTRSIPLWATVNGANSTLLGLCRAGVPRLKLPRPAPIIMILLLPERCASERNRDMISLGSLCAEPEARDNRPSSRVTKQTMILLKSESYALLETVPG
eukprot:3011312-Rhodomonas_salina.1